MTISDLLQESAVSEQTSAPVANARGEGEAFDATLPKPEDGYEETVPSPVREAGELIDEKYKEVIAGGFSPMTGARAGKNALLEQQGEVDVGVRLGEELDRLGVDGGDIHARICADFIRAKNDQRFRGDPEAMFALGDKFVELVTGVPAKHGNTFNPDGSTPYTSAQAYVNDIVKYIENGYRSIATPEYVALTDALERGDDVKKLGALLGVQSIEVSPFKVSTGPMGIMLPVGDKDPDDFKEEVDKAAGKILAQNFIAEYQYYDQFLGERGRKIVRAAIEKGDGMPHELGHEFELLSVTDPKEAEIVSHLIESSRLKVPAFWKDAYMMPARLSRDIIEGTVNFFDNAGYAAMHDGLEEDIKRWMEGENYVSPLEEKRKLALRTFLDKVSKYAEATDEDRAAIAARIKASDEAYRNLSAQDREIERKTELTLRNATEHQPYGDYNWIESSILGAITTVPYMAATALPGGVFVNVASHFENVSDEIILAGGDPQKANALRFGLSMVWALTEGVQWEGMFGRTLTDIEKKKIMADASLWMKAKIWGKEFVVSDFLESGEEGLQGFVESIEKNLGIGKADAWKMARDAWNQFGNDFKESLGTMGILSAGGVAVKYRRLHQKSLDSESMRVVAEKWRTALSNVRGNVIHNTERQQTEARKAKREAAKQRRVMQVTQKAADIWDATESKDEAMARIESELGLSPEACDSLADLFELRDVVLKEAGANENANDAMRDTMIANGMDPLTASTIFDGKRKLRIHKSSDSDEVYTPKEHFEALLPGSRVEQVTATTKDAEGKDVERKAWKVSFNVKDKDGNDNERSFVVVESEEAPDIHSDGFATSASDAMRSAVGKKVFGNVEIIDGNTLTTEQFAALQPEQKLAVAVTRDQYLSMTNDERTAYAKVHGIKTGGNFEYRDAENNRLFDTNGVVTLMRSLNEFVNRGGNWTLTHESGHGMIRFARQLGVFGDEQGMVTNEAGEKALHPYVQLMRDLFGNPTEGVDELWNEEAMNNQLADEGTYSNLRKKLDAKQDRLWRRMLRAVLDFLGDLIHPFRSNSVAEEQAKMREDAKNAVFEAVRLGDFSGLSPYAGIRFASENKAEKPTEARTEAATPSPNRTEGAQDATGAASPAQPAQTAAPTSSASQRVSEAKKKRNQQGAPASGGQIGALEAKVDVLMRQIANLTEQLANSPGIVAGALPKRTGVKGKIKTPDRTMSVDFEYVVLDLDNYKPAFGDYQDRVDRIEGGVTSAAQVMEKTGKRRDANGNLVSNFDWEAFTDSKLSDDGAPIVIGGGLPLIEVLPPEERAKVSEMTASGNGRTMFLKRLVENGEFESLYLEPIKKWAAEQGIPMSAFDGKNHPYVVRRITGGLNTRQELVEFCEKSNNWGGKQKSPVEHALRNLDKITPELMRLYNPGTDGDLLAPSNRAFMAKFLKDIGSTGLVNVTDGTPNNLAELAVEQALIAKLFGRDDVGRAMVKYLLERHREFSLGRIRDAIIDVAGDLYAMRNEHGSFNITDPVGRAVKVYVSWRVARKNSEGLSLNDYLAQNSLFGDNPLAVDQQLARIMEAGRLGRVLKKYADLVRQETVDAQGTFDLGEAKRTPAILLHLADKATLREGEAVCTLDEAKVRELEAEEAARQPIPAPVSDEESMRILPDNRAERDKVVEQEFKAWYDALPPDQRQFVDGLIDQSKPYTEEDAQAARELFEQEMAALESADDALKGNTPFVPSPVVRGTAQLPTGAGIEGYQVDAQGRVVGSKQSLPAGAWNLLRAPYDVRKPYAPSAQDRAGRGLGINNPTAALDNKGRLWNRIFPHFQGNKTVMADRTSQAIRNIMTKGEREHYTTLVDYFGGGGCWGLYHALTNFPNVKTLHINEWDAGRLAKIRLLHEIDGAVADRARQILLDNQANYNLIRQACLVRVSLGRDGFKMVESGSGATIANKVASLMGQLDLGSVEEAQGVITAFLDCAHTMLANVKDDTGFYSTNAGIEKVLEFLKEDGRKAKEAADAFKARGGTINYRQGDAANYPDAPHGDTVMTVCDPPYYLTAGYNGQVSVPLETDMGWSYRTTENLLKKLVDNGDGIIYTDEAWWNKEAYSPKTNADMLRGGRSDFDLEQEILLGIINTLDNFDVAGRVEGRQEVLGVHHGHAVDTGKDGGTESGNARSDDAGRGNDRGADGSLRASVRRMDGRFEDAFGAAGESRPSGGREGYADRLIAFETCVQSIEDAIEAAGVTVLPQNDAVVRQTLRAVQPHRMAEYAAFAAKNAAGFIDSVDGDIDAIDELPIPNEMRLDKGCGDVRYSVQMGNRAKEEARRMIAKYRPGIHGYLTNYNGKMMHEDDAAIEAIAAFDTPKERKTALFWFCKNTVRLPEDSPKIVEAIKTAERAKVDPFRFERPGDILDIYAKYRPVDPPINPDTVPELSDRREVGHGIVTYLVQDDKAGQEAMRRIMNTHFGKDASPWCLLQGDGQGGLSDSAWRYWNNYNALPKRVAFKDGKLIAFMATDKSPQRDYLMETGNYAISGNGRGFTKAFEKWLESHNFEQWWDRRDQSHNGIPFSDIDEEGRTVEQEMLADGTSKVLKMSKGDPTADGVYEEWNVNSQTSYHVVAERLNGQMMARRDFYENGQLCRELIYPKGSDLRGVYIERGFDFDGRPTYVRTSSSAGYASVTQHNVLGNIKIETKNEVGTIYETLKTDHIAGQSFATYTSERFSEGEYGTDYITFRDGKAETAGREMFGHKHPMHIVPELYIPDVKFEDYASLVEAAWADGMAMPPPIQTLITSRPAPRFSVRLGDNRAINYGIINADDWNKFIRKVTRDREGRSFGASVAARLGRDADYAGGERIDGETLTAVFESFGPDEWQNTLFGIVYPVAERLGVTFDVISAGRPDAEELGAELAGHVILHPDVIDAADSDVPTTILHELIHSVSTYAIDRFMNGTGFESVKLSPAVSDAVRKINKLFTDNLPWIKGLYGATNLNEFVAELANPAFRRELQRRGFWDKVVDFLVDLWNDIIGNPTVTRGSAQYDKAVDALNTLLAVTDPVMFDQAREAASEYLRQHPEMRDELSPIVQAEEAYSRRRAQAESDLVSARHSVKTAYSDAEKYTDQWLEGAAYKGDMTAIAEWFDRRWSALTARVRKHKIGFEDAEDLVANIRATCFEKFSSDRNRPKYNFGKFVYGAIKNLVLDTVNRRKGGVGTRENLVLDEAAYDNDKRGESREDRIDLVAAPAYDHNKDAARQRVDEFLSHYTGQRREIFEEVKLDGKDINMLAKAYGVSVDEINALCDAMVAEWVSGAYKTRSMADDEPFKRPAVGGADDMPKSRIVNDWKNGTINWGPEELKKRPGKTKRHRDEVPEQVKRVFRLATAYPEATTKELAAVLGIAVPRISEAIRRGVEKYGLADPRLNGRKLRERKSRYAVRAGGGSYKAEDFAIGYLASTVLSGKEVDPRRVDEILRNVGIRTDAQQIMAKAQELAERKRKRGREVVDNSDPTLISDLMQDSMRERVKTQLANAFATGGSVVDPEIGMALANAANKHQRKLLDRAMGFTAAEMRTEFCVDLSEALLITAEFEKTPEQKAKEEEAKKTEEEKPEVSVDDELAESDEIAEPVEVPDAVKSALNELLNAANIRQQAAEMEKLRKQLAAKQKRDANAAENEDGENGGGDGDGELNEEDFDNPVYNLIKPLFTSNDNFSYFVIEWTARKLSRKYPELGTTDQMWKSPVAIRELQRTAQHLLSKMAQDTLGVSMSRAGAMMDISKLTRFKQLESTRKMIAHIYGRIHESALRISRKKLVHDLIYGNRKEGVLGIRQYAEMRGRFQSTREDLKRKIDAQTELWCRHIVPYLTMSEEKLAQEITDLEAKIKAYEHAADETGYQVESDTHYQIAQDKLALAKKYGGMIRWMPSQILEAAKEIREMLDGRRAEFEERRLVREEEDKEVRDALIAAMSQRSATENFVSRLFRGLGMITDSLVGNLQLELEDLIKYCQDKGLRDQAMNAIEDIMYLVSDGTETYYTTMGQANKEINKGLEECYGDATQGLKHLREELPEEVAAKFFKQNPRAKFKPTYGHLIQLYASCLQVDYSENVKAHDRAQQIEAMEKALTDKDLAFHAWAVAWYADNRDSLSEANEEITGLPVSSPDRLYCPVRMLNESSGFGGKHKQWTPVPSALSRRIKNSLDFDERVSFLDMLNEAAETRAQLIGYGMAGIRLRDILAHHDVQVAARQHIGTGPLGKVIDHVQDVLMQGADRKVPNAWVRMFNWGRAWIAKFALSGNLIPAVKQLASMPVWVNLPNCGFKDVARYLATPFTEAGQQALAKLKNSAGWKARYEFGWSEETMNILRNPNKSHISKLYNGGMIVNKVFDGLSCAWMAQGYFRDQYAHFIDRGFSPEEAEKRALTMTMAACEQGQQSGRIENMNWMQRNHGEWAGLLFQFLTAPLLQANYEYKAFQGVVAGTPGAKGRLLRALVINHILIPGFLMTIQVAWNALCGEPFPPDDEDKLNEFKKELGWQMLVGSFAPLYILPRVAEGMYNLFTGRKTPFRMHRGTAAEQTYDIIVDGVRLAVDAGKYGLQEYTQADFEEEVTTEKLWEEFDRILRETNAPYRQVRRIIKGREE